jgi:hypothetical protein
MHAGLAPTVAQVEVAAQAFAAYMRIPCLEIFHAALNPAVVEPARNPVVTIGRRSDDGLGPVVALLAMVPADGFSRARA